MPKLLRCPKCGHGYSWSVRRGHRKCKSKKCRHEWSPGNIHPVRGFRLARREWMRIIDSFLRDGAAAKVADECRIAYPTAHKAVTAIRQVMHDDVPEILCGTCEADETYVGGSWRNKAVHIRRQGTKRGRGTSKQPIFGLIQRTQDDLHDRSQVRVWLTPDTKNRTLMPHVRKTVCRGSAVYTDGRRGYRHLPRYGYLHEWVDHDAGEYVRGQVHTQNMDGCWGRLKTHLDSIGGIRKECLHLFVGEHVWRFNHRHLTRREQAKRIYSHLTEIGGR